MRYQRPQADILARRLAEPRRFIQAVAGPRQVGKTTLAQQVVEAAGLPIGWRVVHGPHIALDMLAAKRAAYGDVHVGTAGGSAR